MKNFFKQNWPLFIIIVLGLIPLWWFREGNLIAGGDNLIYLDPSANFYHYYYTWFDKLDAGSPSLVRPEIFPFSPFWAVGKAVGLSLVDIQRFWVVVNFMLPGIFMYLLIRYCVNKDNVSEEKGKVAGLIGAISYMFNFLVIVDAFQPVLRPVSTFLPLMLYFWIRGLNSDKYSLKYVSLTALTSLLFASSNINIANVFPLYFIMGIYLLYFLITTRRIKLGLIFSINIFVFFILLNLWWLTNFYFSVIKTSQEVVSSVRSLSYLKSTFINESFRTMGFWGFLQFNNNKLLVPFAKYYYLFPLIFLTFLIPVLGFSSLLFDKNKSWKSFFLLLILIGVFLSKGANFPFGFFYQFFYEKVHGFAVFREPFSKFTLVTVFSLSVLLGFFAEDVYLFLIKCGRKKLAHFTTVCLGLLVLACWYSLLLGKNIQDKTWYQDTRKSLYIKVPDYWYQAGDWFKKNNPDTKVMLFPKTYYGQNYNWDLGVSSGDPVALYLIPNPLIRYSTWIFNEENRLVQTVYLLSYFDKNINLEPYLNLFAIDFVLQQNDIPADENNFIANPSFMSEVYKNQKNLKPTRSVGLLDIYSVLPKGSLLQVYCPDKIVYVSGKLESYPDLFSFYEYSRKDSFIFLDEKNSIKEMIKGSGTETKYFMNLKERQRLKKDGNETVFDVNIPRRNNYSLLINENLFKYGLETDTAAYSLKIAGKEVIIPSSGNGLWRKADLGTLFEGNAVLKTNLPVEILNKANYQSPFWLIESDSLFKSSQAASSENLSSYKKVNPVHYKIEIKKPDKPFLLILSEAFNHYWELYYKGRRLKIDNFLVNGYANGWYILPEMVNPDDLQLDLKYEPQKYADIGLVISLLTVLFIFGYFLVEKIIRKNN